MIEIKPNVLTPYIETKYIYNLRKNLRADRLDFPNFDENTYTKDTVIKAGFGMFVQGSYESNETFYTLKCSSGIILPTQNDENDALDIIKLSIGYRVFISIDKKDVDTSDGLAGISVNASNGKYNVQKIIVGYGLGQIEGGEALLTKLIKEVNKDKKDITLYKIKHAMDELTFCIVEFIKESKKGKINDDGNKTYPIIETDVSSYNLKKV